MTTILTTELTIEPLLQYPRLAAVTKPFLLTVDFKPSQYGETWTYSELEEIPIRCIVTPGKLFRVEFIGEPVVIIHRYGGTYGSAKFLLTPEPSSLHQSGKIQITLTNRFGVPITLIETEEIEVRELVSDQALIEIATGTKPPELIEYEFESAVFKEKADTKEIDWKTLEFETVDLIVEDSVTFEFETARFEGEELQRETKTAEGFVEILKAGHTSEEMATDEGEEKLETQIGLDMVRIPAGTFVMGAPESDKGSNNKERPQHLVKVSEFYLGRFLVTQEQWQEVASWAQVERKLDLKPSRFRGENFPVEGVSWDDAKEFCARLSQKTGRNYRLPSEAEWEYACRAIRDFPSSDSREAGSPQEEQSLIEQWNDEHYQPYSYGRLSPEVAHYDQDLSSGRTVPVGSLPANGFGLYDMHGNLWEWCEDDWHSNYEDAPNDGSPWIENNSTKKIRRGGSWYNYPRNCRSAYRDDVERDDRSNDIGFRVACSPQGFS